MTRARPLFVPLALLATLLAAIGFWPTYFGPLLAGTVDKPAIIHVHAAVFVTWLGLVITQATLAASGRVALHVRLGPWLFGFGVLVIATGLTVALDRFGHTYLVNGVGLAVMVAMRLVIPLHDSQPWLALTGWLATLYR